MLKRWFRNNKKVFSAEIQGDMAIINIEGKIMIKTVKWLEIYIQEIGAEEFVDELDTMFA